MAKKKPNNLPLIRGLIIGGVATSMLNQSYGRGAGSAYQVGGPRTLQFALRLQF